MCSDLEDLIGRVNPAVLTSCARDADCTNVTCETIGTTRNVFTSIGISLSPCRTPPEVIIQIFEGEVPRITARSPRQIVVKGVIVLNVFLDFTSASVEVAVSYTCM